VRINGRRDVTPAHAAEIRCRQVDALLLQRRKLLEPVRETLQLRLLECGAPVGECRGDAHRRPEEAQVEAHTVLIRRLDLVRPDVAIVEAEAAERQVLVVVVGERLRLRGRHAREHQKAEQQQLPHPPSVALVPVSSIPWCPISIRAASCVNRTASVTRSSVAASTAVPAARRCSTPRGSGGTTALPLPDPSLPPDTCRSRGP